MDSSTLTSAQIKARAEREARRGRGRDADGKIVFSKEQLLQRKAHFEAKMKDGEKRIDNIKKILKEIESQLK
jgi:hypothetical protein